MTTRPDPLPGPGQLQVSVSACGVCRTDLHVVDGELSEAKLPIIPGHEIVGTVSALGEGVDLEDAHWAVHVNVIAVSLYIQRVGLREKTRQSLPNFPI